MAAVVGFAFLGVVGDDSQKTSFPPCRRHHPQRHALHGDNSCHGKKAAFGRSKSPPLAVKKQQLVLSQLYDATDR